MSNWKSPGETSEAHLVRDERVLNLVVSVLRLVPVLLLTTLGHEHDNGAVACATGASDALEL